MYCSNCGNKIADDARFCSFCGTRVAEIPAEEAAPATEAVQPAEAPVVEEAPVEAVVEQPVEPAPVVEEPAPAPEPVVETPAPAKSTLFDEFQWNVSEYPTADSYQKTEDINFDWNADPSTIFTGRGMNDRTAAEIRAKADLIDEGETVVTTKTNSAADAVNGISVGSSSAAIDNFYTINKKNEEFQQLLNKEYEKVKAGNTIGDELSAAEQLAEEKFETRPEDMSMEAFLEREGVEKPYEPKAFETDVLKRIDAQEKAKERKRLEEEAREKALEEARQEALAKKKAEEAEAARQAVEEAENKRLQAIAEAQAKAEAEAKAKAEAEAKAREEAEAARIRAEEEAATKAEADRKAALEAEKIRQQREARFAAEEAAKAKAEDERRRYEEARLKSKLEQERQELSRKAESAAAAEEARRVLEQTTRMREEEAAKIKAAIAGLRGEITNHGQIAKAPAEAAPAAAEVAAALEEAATPAPEVKEAPASVAESVAAALDSALETVEETPVPEAPAAPAVETPAPVVEETPVAPVVEAAAAAAAAALGAAAETPSAPVVEAPAEPAVEEPVTELTLEDLIAPAEEQTDLTHTQRMPKISKEVKDAHQATKSQINEMAKARDTYFATFYGEESLADQMKKEAANPQVETPAPVQEEVVKTSVDDLTKTRVIDKSAVLAGLETTRRISKAELRAQEDKEFFESLEAAGTPVAAPEQNLSETITFKDNAQTVEDLLAQFETVNSGQEGAVDPIIASLPDEVETPEEAAIPEGYAVKEEPTIIPPVIPAVEERPGLTDTMIMPGKELETSITNDFDNYGVEEAENFKKQQEIAAVAPAVEEAAPVAEVPAVETPAAPVVVEDEAETDDYEEEKSGGIGHLILKIILILLIIVFAAELIGMGIKFLAPNSGAAELIDSQLEKIIGLITG